MPVRFRDIWIGAGVARPCSCVRVCVSVVQTGRRGLNMSMTELCSTSYLSKWLSMTSTINSPFLSTFGTLKTASLRVEHASTPTTSRHVRNQWPDSPHFTGVQCITIALQSQKAVFLYSSSLRNTSYMHLPHCNSLGSICRRWWWAEAECSTSWQWRSTAERQ